MLRRTSKCLSRRQALLSRPRYLSTTLPNRFATPTSGFAPTWDKIKESLKAPVEQFTPTLRPSYTTESFSSETPDHLVRTCTVLTSSPKATPLEELLDRIPQFQAGNETGLFTDFLLLVTPSYAADLRKQKHVIEKALTRIFSVRELDKDLHSRLGGDSREAVRLVAAVVDRLPKPSDLDASAVGDIGSEGIALRLIANENPIWKPELAKDDPRAALSDNKYRFLSFHLDDAATPAHMLPIVQLPLANTIFHNGLTSTLIWRKYSLQKDGKGLVQIDEQVCDSHRVKLPKPSVSRQTTTLALSAPLVPLTSARSVVACMGNIIRRLSADSGLGSHDPTKEAILASHELEQSVTSYHKTRGLSPRAVSVWALVIPEKTFSGGLSMAAKVLGERDLPELWKSGSNHDTDASQPNLLTLLQHGARLHKVLSGGGGWGKKAGLLSLDPDSGYGQHPPWEDIAPAQQTDAEYIEGLSPVPADLHHVWGFEPQELPSIVNKGDFIQFYISPSASSEEALAQHKIGDNAHESIPADVKTVEFGSVPSTVDDMPSSQKTAFQGQDTVQTYPNHFGALSETGIAMFFGLQSSKESSSKVHDAQDAATKIDVPFGRIRSRSQSSVSSKAKQAQAGFGFSPSTPLQSWTSSHHLFGRKLTRYQTPQRNLATDSAPPDRDAPPKHSDNTIWQGARKSAFTPRELRKISRVPKIPNKNWTSGDINEARRAIKQAKVQTESEGSEAKTESLNLTFKISKTTKWDSLDVPMDQLYISSLTGARHQSWATQTLQDVISPEAFEQWTKDGTIPKTQDSVWSHKDIRQAHTLKKRRWKLHKQLAPIRERLDNTVTTFRRLDMETTPRTIKSREHIQDGNTAPRQGKTTANKIKSAAKGQTQEVEPPTIAALKVQAQSRARARILKEAFRGLLSPAQQRRALIHKASLSANKTFHVTDALLTHRIMNLITIHEAGSPRIRIYELLDIERLPLDEEMNMTIEKEKRAQKKDELKKEFYSWKAAVEELKEVVEVKWPEESKKTKIKEVVEHEMDEIRRLEESVSEFLVR
ncbi:hypothetical protein E4T43_06829 [Aureobasidium subglaciale]|nr:hypothetical protein E4T43_06829 [Aureobasidium subglaciale]